MLIERIKRNASISNHKIADILVKKSIIHIHERYIVTVMNNNFIHSMQYAYNAAKEAFEHNEVPIGAVIVNLQGEIVARAFNQVIALQDPTAHAEVLAIRQACSFLKSRYLENCSIYVTLEPCAMCAYAISLARLKRLYFGAYDKKFGGVENGAKVLQNSACHSKIEIYGGIMELECAKLLRSFFREF